MPLAPGTRLDQYEIVAPLAAGGMGELYRARDTRLGREVAIKVLPERTALDPDALERFEREAKALAALSHPNILSIFQFGTDSAVTYAVMELLEGETLRSRILRSPIAASKLIEIGLAITEGLAAAHSRGIIHRDLKPENIFLTATGGVKILDFGLARLDADPPAPAEGESKLATLPGTQPGTVLGTVGYMSPEQVRGQSLDTRTDIFSLGCILYEMATGNGPFVRNTAADTMAAILNYDPPEISTSGKEIPPEMDRVILHCLEKNPDDRFQSARDLSFDLREIGSGIRLTRPIQPARTTRLSRAGIILSIFLVLVALAGIYWFVRMRAAPETGARIPVAVADFVNETGEKDLDGLSGMLITSLEQSRRLAVMTRSRMLDVLKQMGKEDAARIDEDLGREICKRANVNALILASIRKFDQLYTIDLKVLDPDKNEYLFTTKQQATGKASVPEMIDKLSEATRSGLKEKTAEIQAASRKVTDVTTSNLEAYQHLFRGEEFINKLQFKEAEEELRKATAIDPTFALAHWRLGYAISWMNIQRALPSLETSLRYIDKLPEKEQMAVRATKAYVDRNLTEAFKQLGELVRRFPKEKEALFTMGDWNYHNGRMQEATHYFNQVLVLDPNFERALQHLVWTYAAVGQYDRAVQTAEIAVTRTRATQAYYQLFQSYKMNGNYDKAEQLANDATKHMPDSTGGIERSIAEIDTLRLQFAEAEARCRKILASSDKSDAQKEGYGCLTDFYVYTGRYRDALKMKQQQIDIKIKSNDMDSVANNYADLAYIALLGLNDRDTANRALDDSLRHLDKLNEVPHGVFDTLNFAGRVEEAMKVGNTYLWGHRPGWDISLRANQKLKQGDLAAAAKDFEYLSSRGVPVDRAFSLYQLALLCDRMKDYDRGIEAMNRYHADKFSKTTWEYPRALYLTGSFYTKKGDTKRAKEYYRKFLDIWKSADPDRPELAEARKQLQL